MKYAETDRVKAAMKDKAEGSRTFANLRWDPETKTIREFAPNEPDRGGLVINNEIDHFGGGSAPPAPIVLPEQLLSERKAEGNSISTSFRLLDGDVYSAIADDARSHNQSLLESLQWLDRSRGADPHLRACNRALALTLRSLRTRAASPWFAPVEATS